LGITNLSRLNRIQSLLRQPRAESGLARSLDRVLIVEALDGTSTPAGRARRTCISPHRQV